RKCSTRGDRPEHVNENEPPVQRSAVFVLLGSLSPRERVRVRGKNSKASTIHRHTLTPALSQGERGTHLTFLPYSPPPRLCGRRLAPLHRPRFFLRARAALSSDLRSRVRRSRRSASAPARACRRDTCDGFRGSSPSDRRSASSSCYTARTDANRL